jgi:predicted nucleic acid-binding protein
LRGWLLDTNVVSEVQRRRPSEIVVAWLQKLPPDRTFISILTLGEIDQGIEVLPSDDPGRARLLRFRNRIEAQFAGRILSLDDETVRLWGAMSGRYRRALGGKAPVIDTMLVATAQRRRLYLATRNLSDTTPHGWPVFNPWTDDAADFPLQA